MKVGVQHEVGPGGEFAGQAQWENTRCAANGPATQPTKAAGENVVAAATARTARAAADAAHTAKAGRPLCAVGLAGLAALVDADDDVVQHSAGRGAHLEAGDPLVLFQIHRDAKTAVNVGAVGAHGVGLGHFHDEIRLAEQPVAGKLGRLGELVGRPLGHAGGMPVFERGQLVGGQAAFIDEFAVPLDRVPRRHVAILRDLGD